MVTVAASVVVVEAVADAAVLDAVVGVVAVACCCWLEYLKCK